MTGGTHSWSLTMEGTVVAKEKLELKMRYLRDFAEVPGAVILVLVSWFQIGLSSSAQLEVLNGHIFALEDQMYDVCSRLSNLEIIAGRQSGHCDRFPYDPISQGPGHLTWPEAARAFGAIEHYAFLVGLTLFVVGIIYRLHRSHQ